MSSLKYNLTDQDFEFVDQKIEKQKKFLSEFVIDVFDTPFNLLDSCMGANINPKKYFAEVNNRVNSLFKYSKMLDLYPVFLTITCPPQFHSNSKNYDGSSVKDSVAYLSRRWASFLRLKIFKNIKTAISHNMVYIRVLEPHKDGTPHCHVLIFVPKNFILPVKKVFKRHFAVDGATAINQSFKYTWSGNAGGAVAYIMKYINKTFKHALDDRMTLEAYYYALHSIRRFTTSQTLVPLYVYRKLKHNEKFQDFIWTTLKYKDGTIYHIYDKKIFLYRYMTEDDGYQEEVLFSRSPDLDQLFPKKSYQKFPKSINRSKKFSPPAPVIINGQLSNYVFEKDRFHTVKKPFFKYSNWELLEYYNALDVDQCDINHFIQIRNMCVGRDLIDSCPILTAQIFGFDDYKELIKIA